MTPPPATRVAGGAAVATMTSLFGLDPASHVPHALHSDQRTYTETNCFADCLIELVAALGSAPEAMFVGAVEVDYELDQWTFFKPPAEDLRRLYGIELHEMQPYRGLPDQIAVRLAHGQTLVPELDAFFMPDTAATSYRTEHVKTSVVAESIDVPGRVFRYFHNAGYYELSGADFDGVFAQHVGAGMMTPYVDLVRFDAGPLLAGADLRGAALTLLREHLVRRPTANPFVLFGERLAVDLPGLLEGDLADYHSYAFANARMAGASFELLASSVRWLFGEAGEQAAAELDDVVGGTKMLLFRLARRRGFDVDGVVAPMAQGWASALARLEALA